MRPNKIELSNIAYEIIATTPLGRVSISTLGRRDAEMFAEAYYKCIEVTTVDVINAFTGELVYHKDKEE